MPSDRNAKIKARHEQARGFTDAELIAFVDTGAGNAEIREKFNCSQKTIRLILHKNGRKSLGRDYSDTVWTKEVTEQFHVLRLQGLSSSEIGLRLGVTANAVIGKSNRIDASIPKKPIKRTPEKAAMVEQMLRNGMSNYRIAESAHVCLPFVRSIRNMLGIPIIRHYHRRALWRRKPASQFIAPTRVAIVYSDESSIAEFIARNGVTKCPSAAAAATSAVIPATDTIALRAHHNARDEAYRAEVAPRQQRATEASRRALAMRSIT